GLVVDLKLAERQRLAQVRFELDALDGERAHARVEHRMARLSADLGAVHGDVRVAQQALRIGSGRAAECQADAGAYQDFALADEERATQNLADPLDNLFGLSFVFEILQQDRELVPAQSRDGVRGAHARLESLRDLAQQGVTGLVAPGVVYPLEVRQVQAG